MGIERIGGGYIKIAVSKEDLEESISNGNNKHQAAVDSAQIKKHFDTAIDAMTMLLSGFDVYGKGKEREDD